MMLCSIAFPAHKILWNALFAFESKQQNISLKNNAQSSSLIYLLDSHSIETSWFGHPIPPAAACLATPGCPWPGKGQAQRPAHRARPRGISLPARLSPRDSTGISERKLTEIRVLDTLLYSDKDYFFMLKPCFHNANLLTDEISIFLVLGNTVQLTLNKHIC